MKKLLFLLTLLCLEKALHAQQPYIYTIKADSVKITNSCDTAELIIENHTQNVPGFLFNKGRGRTEFRRVNLFDDTTVIIGGDTIHLGRGNKNFANADLTLTDNRVHNGALHSVDLTDFGRITMKARSSDNNISSQLKLDTSQYLRCDFKNYSDPNNLVSANFSAGTGKISYLTNQAGGTNQGVFNVSPNQFVLSAYRNSGVDWAFIGAKNNPDNDHTDLTIRDSGGDLYISNDGSNGRTGIFFNQGESLVLVQGPGDEFNTSFSLTPDSIVFRNYNGPNDFRLVGLPESSSTADSMLVVDANGQVKRRSQSPTRKSTTVTGSSYTVPSDIDVVFVNYTAGQATITLPTGTLDREITIKNLNITNTVILSGLDTNESNSIATRGAITVKYTGNSWVGIGKY